MYHFTLQLWQLGAIFIASLLYAIFISWPPILAIDDDREQRWIVTAGGVAIVVALATATGAATTLDLFAAFGVSAVPIWLRASAFRYIDQRQRAIRQANDGTQSPTA